MISSQTAIIVFQKNPVAGKVKTRLAATMGNVRALEIYEELVGHTHSVLEQLDEADVYIYMSDSDDVYHFNPSFQVKLQKGEDLGSRMKQAFEATFQLGYKKVFIIGTDCPGINQKILNQGIQSLSEKQVVIGPAKDGGYYLLGMNACYPYLFENISWSTSEVLNQTIQCIIDNNLSHCLLKKLRDIDTEEDYVAEAAKLKI